MKRIRRIIVLVILSALLSILLIFSIYGNRLMISLIRPVLNESFKTEVKASKINFTLIKKFPTASIEISELTIKNPEFFYNLDTNMLYARKVNVSISLLHLIKTKKIKIKNIKISDGYINYLVQNKRVNINEIISHQKESSNTSANLTIKNIGLKKFDLNYIDLKNSIAIRKSKTEINNLIINDSVSFDIISMGEIQRLYIQKKEYSFVDDFDFGGHLTFANEAFYSSDLRIKILKTDFVSSFNFDIKQENKSWINIHAGAINMSNLQNLISDKLPIYLNINDLSVSLDCNYKIVNKEGYIKINSINDSKIELYNNSYRTSLDINYAIKENALRIDDLKLTNQKDTLIVKGIISKKQLKNTNFYFNTELSQYQPLFAKYIVAPTGRIKGKLNWTGSLDLSDSISVKTLKGIKPRGSISFSNVSFSLLKSANGFSNLNGSVIIDSAILLEKVSFLWGESDLSINGKIDNWYNGLVEDGNIMNVDLDLKSEKISIHTAEEKSNTPNSAKIIELPNNISGSVRFIVDSLVVNTFAGKNFESILFYASRKLNVRKSSIQAFGGRINGGATIIQSFDKRFVLKSQCEFEHLSVNKTFSAFKNFGQDIITDENISGDISGNATLNAKLNTNFKLEKDELSSEIQTRIDNGILKDFKPIYQLKKYVEEEYLREIHFSSFENNISIKNKAFEIPWMDLKSDLLDVSVFGQYKFDKSYNFRFKLYLSDILYKKYKNANPDEKGNFITETQNRYAIFLQASGDSLNSSLQYDFDTQKQSLFKKLKAEKNFLKGLFKKDTIQSNKKKDASFEIDWEEIH